MGGHACWDNSPHFLERTGPDTLCTHHTSPDDILTLAPHPVGPSAAVWNRVPTFNWDTCMYKH